MLDNFIYVSSVNGASKHFIATLITYLINDLSPDIDYESHNTSFSNFATYHNEFDNILDNVHTSRTVKWPPWKEINFSNTDTYKSLGFPGEGIPMYQDIISDFPNFKVVVITVDPADYKTVELNHFWKQDPAFYLDQLGIEVIDHGVLISPDQASEYIDQYLEKGIPEYFKLTDPDACQNWYKRLPTNIRERYFFINFADIISDPETVISSLENITQKTFDDNMKKRYYHYVDLQIEYYKKYLPWHPILQKGQ